MTDSCELLASADGAAIARAVAASATAAIRAMHPRHFGPPRAAVVGRNVSGGSAACGLQLDRRQPGIWDRVGMEQVRELADAVRQAWSRAREVTVGVHRYDAAGQVEACR